MDAKIKQTAAKVLSNAAGVLSIAAKVFCPTGPGGGVDPTCGGGSGGKVRVAQIESAMEGSEDWVFTTTGSNSTYRSYNLLDPPSKLGEVSISIGTTGRLFVDVIEPIDRVPWQEARKEMKWSKDVGKLQNEMKELSNNLRKLTWDDLESEGFEIDEG